jgi:hypothetical protein
MYGGSLALNDETSIALGLLLLARVGIYPPAINELGLPPIRGIRLNDIGTCYHVFWRDKIGAHQCARVPAHPWYLRFKQWVFCRIDEW